MYGKLLDRNRKLVENRLDDLLKAQRHAVDRIVHRYGQLGAVLLDPDVGDDELRARLLTTVPEAQLREDQSDLANWTRGDRKARFEQTAERHAGLSQFAAPFLSRMKFVDEQGEGASPTLSALRAYREHRAAGRRGLPPEAPLDFAPAALQPLIRHNGVTDRRRWESALFLKVRDEIQTGNLAIDGAKNFSRFEAFFLPTAQWEQVREAFWARTGFPVAPDAAVPMPGCTSSYIFNYYGSGGPAVDPACHPDATAVQSYRHSHYGKDRFGVTLDEEWFTTIGAAGSTLRAGIWYEDSRRDLGRDWHQMLDPTLNFNWNEQPYWQQYEWDFPQRVFKWYVEETIFAGPFALSGGVKQFLVGLSREDLFGVDPNLDVDSDSNLLVSGGVTYETPVAGLDLFAGYSENFKALSALLLEVPGRSLDLLEPETASNIDVGLQYSGERVALGATWYTIDFRNRIFYLGPQTPTGPNYLIPGGGAYFNAGGIDTSGFELSATVQMPQRTSFYTAFTLNDSEYIGTGDPLVDASQGLVAGTDVTGVPDRLWVVSLDRTGPLGMGLTGKYTSSRRVSLRSDWYADAYWLVGAYVSFSGEALSDLLRSTEFAIVANNLLDKAYLSAITENAAWLGAPRTISMTATVSF